MGKVGHQRSEKMDNQVEDIDAECVGDDVPALSKVTATE